MPECTSIPIKNVGSFIGCPRLEAIHSDRPSCTISLRGDEWHASQQNGGKGLPHGGVLVNVTVDDQVGERLGASNRCGS